MRFQRPPALDGESVRYNQGAWAQLAFQLWAKSGKHISPAVPEGVKNYLIDIDGTVTEDVPNEEPERMVTCAPFPDALETLNRWFDEGHIITFFTSRTEEHRGVTEEWLTRHGFKYHGLLMNKQTIPTILSQK